MAEKNNIPVLKVREYRIRMGLSQNALAKKSEVSQAHISEIESGVKGVGLDITRKLAKALGVTVGELMSDEEEITEGE